MLTDEERKTRHAMNSRHYRLKHPEAYDPTYHHRWVEANRERVRKTFVAWYEANREKLAKQGAARYQANKERRRKTDAVWYETNKERARKTRTAWRTANPETFRNGIAKWQKANQERIALYHGKRRSLKYANTPLDQMLTSTEWLAILAEANGHCAYCGKEASLTLDHVIPLSKGGKHSKDNVVPACAHCNSSKGNKTLEEWNRKRLTQVKQ